MFRFLTACLHNIMGALYKWNYPNANTNSNVQIRLTASAYHSRYDLPTIAATTDICIAIQETSKRFMHIERQKLHKMHCRTGVCTEYVFACTKQFVINANRRQVARIYVTISLWDGYTFAALVYVVSCFTAKKKKQISIYTIPLYEDVYLHWFCCNSSKSTCLQCWKLILNYNKWPIKIWHEQTRGATS